jgi:UDP-N-acetylmuramoylalanine--D-glutamate ligase|tara:strand:- start:1466 stop:2809 length:1344 start_codon:yes stop_codon:yes gene_type:complete
MNLDNKNIGILGLGVSGYSAAKLASSLGANVFVSDSKSDVNDSYMKELTNMGVDIELGLHSEKILNSDLIIKSPGIPNDIEIIQSILDSKTEVISEIEFAYRMSDLKIIAITGTNGKTTTVTCLYEVLKKKFNVVKSGNIGTPFSEIIYKENKYKTLDTDFCILELSSFQIDDIDTFKPDIAMILNISPDHLDRYADFSDYSKSKMNLFKNMKDSDLIIYNHDDNVLCDEVEKRDKIFTAYSLNKNFSIFYLKDKKIESVHSKKNLHIDECELSGIHNISNFIGVATIASHLGLDDKDIFQSLKMFKGLHHRFEIFKQVDGIKFINDSKATNIASVKVAIDSIDRNIVLIMGGLPKESDFSEIIKYSESIKSIIAYGVASDDIYNSLSDSCKVLKIKKFEQAINSAIDLAERGDSVLMSPGCSSYDQFKNFEERGNFFKSIVERHYS